MPYFRVRVSQSRYTTYHIEANRAEDAKQLVREAHAAGKTQLVNGLYRVEDNQDETTEVVRMPDDGEIYREERATNSLKDL